MKYLVVALVLSLASFESRAMDLDWSGQFRSDTNFVNNYTFEQGNLTNDATRTNAEGYYIPGGGQSTAFFQGLFLKLRPVVVVNDNIAIKSEWWVGDPIYGFFGSATPYSIDQKFWYSTQSRGSVITAQRVYGEVQSDVGTIIVGRAPLHWGLGIVWNNGDDLWSRYSSTGDMIRLVSKFGSFSVSPAIIKYGIGNNIGGSCPDPTSTTGGICNGALNSSSVTDYAIYLKYQNMDEEVELGLNYIKRNGSASQGDTGFMGGNGATSGSNYGTWDIYGQKKLGPVSINAEVPLASGTVGVMSYNTFALAFDTRWDITDRWDLGAKFGHAPGQPNTPGGIASFRPFYFHPNYKLGLLMFNYQFRNFAGPSTQNDPRTSPGALVSPYDNPITNAGYVALNGGFKLTPKWHFRMGWLYGWANETAVTGQFFYNQWLRKYAATPAVSAQDSALGWEIDGGVSFLWDEALRFDWDFGWYFPGDFYRFSNTAIENSISNVLGTTFKLGIEF